MFLHIGSNTKQENKYTHMQTYTDQTVKLLFNEFN